MTVPLLYYCARQTHRAWLRAGLYTTMVLTALAAIGTQSRGALLGMAAMGVMFWLKSRQKFMIAVYAATAVLLVIAFMPPEWYERMATIKSYEEDRSATGRINAWHMAWNLASDRPLGGGFETFGREMFHRYAPNPGDFRDVHSVYFEVLGEHGFVGLGLFLILVGFTWFSASGLMRETKTIPEMRWLGELTAMTQVSMIAYATAGAFLGMAYFDYLYNLVVFVVVGRVILQTFRTGLSVGGRTEGQPTQPSAATGLPVPDMAPRALLLSAERGTCGERRRCGSGIGLAVGRT